MLSPSTFSYASPRFMACTGLTCPDPSEFLVGSIGMLSKTSNVDEGGATGENATKISTPGALISAFGEIRIPHNGCSQGGSDGDKSSPSSSPVSVVSNFWKEFDLEKEKSVLDEQELKIAESQENSKKNRWKLAESTRDFKKASPEEKLCLFNSLLKGYQEVVNLTKRAKFGENAFLNIYQKLYEAPDPYPALPSISVIISSDTSYF
ncbi:hypothetical protein F3Y22_tig00111427pilonHSYRG00462 [Hibiscus syriacus]|uniref:Cux N-terminal domain-containing protein n=1 Tax=Hibiscus syriacus TaxID=106335 RepID=A0A6A2YKV0_HIBSY|nr:hypothetical protein F3Y22_tig00111427pilonHSYRG00462 [Hibiscus syriacus]